MRFLRCELELRLSIDQLSLGTWLLMARPNFHTVAYQLTVPKVLPMPCDPAAWDDIHAKCGQLVSCFSVMRCYRSHVSHWVFNLSVLFALFWCNLKNVMKNAWFVLKLGSLLFFKLFHVCNLWGFLRAQRLKGRPDSEGVRLSSVLNFHFFSFLDPQS